MYRQCYVDIRFYLNHYEAVMKLKVKDLIFLIKALWQALKQYKNK